jgi:hypothetical protein
VEVEKKKNQPAFDCPRCQVPIAAGRALEDGANRRGECTRAEARSMESAPSIGGLQLKPTPCNKRVDGANLLAAPFATSMLSPHADESIAFKRVVPLSRRKKLLLLLSTK